LISRDYLQVMGVRVVIGRGFLDIDGEGRPRVLLINQALARRDFTGQDPIGQLVYVGRDTVPWQIVGVVDDVRQFGLDQDAQPQFFIDVRQWPSTAGVLFPIGAYYAIRTSGDPMAAVPQIRGAIREIDPQAALFNTAPMEELVATTTSRPRMYAVLLGIFAAVGVGLAVIGIYGLMAYSVAQRTREIGVRTALGASRRSVLGLVLRQSLVLTGVGILIGLAGAGALSRYLESLLFGVTPADVSTYAAVAALFAAVAAGAALVPAHRATKIEPLTALRYE
jgi:putative ABC transport system permease protein